MPPQLCLCQAVSLSEARGFRRRIFTIIVVRPATSRANRRPRPLRLTTIEPGG